MITVNEAALEPLPRDKQSDRHLVARIGVQDQDAFRELYDIYCRSIASFLAGVAGLPDLVEEMVNDTFMVVWETSRTFDGEARISTWILGIAYRRALTSAGERDRSTGRNGGGTKDPATLGERAGQVEMISSGNAQQRLPFEQRTALQLCYRFGLSPEEIAAVIGRPVNTVKVIMLDARRNLRIAGCTSGSLMPSPRVQSEGEVVPDTSRGQSRGDEVYSSCVRNPNTSDSRSESV